MASSVTGDVSVREVPGQANGSADQEPQPQDNGAVLNGEKHVELRRSKRKHGEDTGDALVGRLLRKRFYRTLHYGTVKSYDDEAGFYRVVYEDDDEEDLEVAELRPLLLPKGEVRPAMQPCAKDGCRSMEAMPDEVLDKIFSFVNLDRGNHALGLMQVCKRWRDLVPFAMITLTMERRFGHFRPNFEQFCKFDFSNLRTLRFEYVFASDTLVDWVEVFKTLGGKCPKLSAIHFSHLDPPLSERDLKELFKSCTDLRTLEIRKSGNLQTFTQIDILSSLSSLDLSHNPPLRSIPPLTALPNLRNLTICAAHRIEHLPPVSSITSNLQTLHLSGHKLASLPDLSALHVLARLTLRCFPLLTSLPSLGSLSLLRELTIAHCQSLREIPLLATLSLLETLWLEGCRRLKSTPPINELASLRVLRLLQCSKLKSISALEASPQLRTLDINGCKSLDFEHLDISSLSRLERLRACSETGCHIAEIRGLPALRSVNISLSPDVNCTLSELPALQDLIVTGRHQYYSIRDFTTVILEDEEGEGEGLRRLREVELRKFPDRKSAEVVAGLTMLERLTLHTAGLENFPELAKLVNLKSLSIQHCGDLVTLTSHKCSALTALTSLAVVRAPNLKRLPGLEHLPALRRLELADCPALRVPDALSRLVGLEELRLRQLDCAAMPAVSTLRRLSMLAVEECHSLVAVPSVGALQSLRNLRLSNLSQLQEVRGLTRLTRLNWLQIQWCWKLDIDAIAAWADTLRPRPHDLMIMKRHPAVHMEEDLEMPDYGEGADDDDLEGSEEEYWGDFTSSSDGRRTSDSEYDSEDDDDDF